MNTSSQEKTTKAFFQLLRIAIGNENAFSYYLNDDEWNWIWDMAHRQALTGVVLDGICLLPQKQRPPQAIILKGVAAIQNIEQANRLLNRYSVLVSQKFQKEGFRSAILKGQGNALWYPNPMHRMPGDIDIWLEGGREKIMAYVRHYFLKASARYHHVDFPIIKGIDIEVHFTPTWMSAYPDNRFLQKWFAEEQEAQFANTVTLPENTGTIPVPTPAFNRIFLLIHIYRHFFDEGIGLRQLLDYAMLLNQGTTEKEKAESVRILKRMHLLRFTSALMHILQNVFGIEGKHLLTAPSEKEGDFILQEIMQNGNFGQHNRNINRQNGKSASYFTSKFLYKTRFLTRYPRETIWGHVFWIGQRIWRWHKRYV